MARHFFFVVAISLALAACKDDTSSSGTASTEVPSQSPVGNISPTIVGAPVTVAKVGTHYSFKPAVKDSNGDPLRFSIEGRPVWTSFNESTGELSGTPTAQQAGTYRGIVVKVSDGAAVASLSPFSIAVVASTQAPSISGSPATSVVVGSLYTFTPAASDPSGDALTFSIQGKPTWATFDPASGTLSGTPTAANIGVASGIVISVSDGAASAALPAFALTVSQIGTGNATLSWTPPVQNTDGSALTNLAGYKVYYGRTSAGLTSSSTIANPGIANYVVENLGAGTWYFSVKAYTSANVESDFSGTVSTVIH